MSLSMEISDTPAKFSVTVADPELEGVTGRRFCAPTLPPAHGPVGGTIVPPKQYVSVSLLCPGVKPPLVVPVALPLRDITMSVRQLDPFAQPTRKGISASATPVALAEKPPGVTGVIMNPASPPVETGVSSI